MNNNHTSNSRTTVVGGRLVREQNSFFSTFSWRRFFFVAVMSSILIISNPANELYDKTIKLFDQITPSSMRKGKKQRELSDWTWRTLLDPPLSVTNYGILTLEERHASVKLVILSSSSSWSCPFFDDTYGAFCSTAAKQLCHGKPLLYDPNNHAYTAHRIICLLLILSAIISFCFQGRIPSISDPFCRAILTSVARQPFSIFTLIMDLFNASMFVYPALVRLEKVVPTLLPKDGAAIASQLGLPAYVDFIFYVVVLVVFVGGGCNSLATFITRQPCTGFDSTVAAAVGYCNAFSPYHHYNYGFGITTTNNTTLISPSTVFWGYLPVTALLGGNVSHVVSWLLAGTLGFLSGQYHLDNQNMWLALAQMVQGIGKP